MSKSPISFQAARDARDADAYRLAQAQTMIDLFKKARGREPETADELVDFLNAEQAAGRLPAGKIQPG